MYIFGYIDNRIKRRAVCAAKQQVVYSKRDFSDLNETRLGPSQHPTDLAAAVVAHSDIHNMPPAAN